MLRSLVFVFTCLFLSVGALVAQPTSMSCPFVQSGTNWVSTSVSALGISTFSGNVQINGSLTVDANFTLDGALIAMNVGPITVQSGVTLRIINGSILTNLQLAWEGIDLEPGAVLEVADSEICGAITAIEANNLFSATAANIEVVNSGLRFNHTGINVSRYTAGAYPAFVVGTHFEGGVLPSGAPTANSYQGIEAFRISGGTGLTIGDVNTAWAANRFTDMELGIDVRACGLEAFNNEFENIQPNTVSGNGIAIRALPNPAGPYVLGVGTSVDRANTMTDCRIGVYSDNMLEVNVSDNTMSAPVGPFEQGIAIYRTQDVVIVGENTIEEFTDIGVLLDQHPGNPSTTTTASINNNVITGTFNTSQGVFVDEFIGGLAIRDNRDITQVHRGITVQTATPSLGSGISIDNNTVELTYPGPGVTTDPAVGILAVTVFDPSIDNNIIGGNCEYPFGGICTTGTTNHSRIRGIQLVRTEEADVFKNIISDCGGGLYVLNANNEGNAICNEFINCYSGVVWSSVGFEEFGVDIAGVPRVYGLIFPNASADNQWVSPVVGYEPIRSYSINGSDAGSIDWYFRTVATYDFPPGTNITDLSPFVSAVDALPGVTTNICPLLPLDGGGGQEESSSSGFQSFSTDRFNRLSSMQTQPIENLSMGDYAYLQGAHLAGSDHSLLQALIGRTNIDALHQMRTDWSNQPFSTSLNLLQTLTPINEEERSIVELWRLRLHAASDSMHTAWSDDDRETIRSIAVSPHAIVGRANSFAGSLLNETFVPDDWKLDAPDYKIAVESASVLTQVFPNPTSDFLRISFAEPMTAIQISNAVGLTVWSQHDPQMGLIEVDCRSWPSGLYWITSIPAVGNIEQVPISIQR